MCSQPERCASQWWMLGGNKRCKMTYCTGDQCQHSNRNIIIHVVPGGAKPFGISFWSPPLWLNQIAEDWILPRLALVASHCLPTCSAKSLIKTKKYIDINVEVDELEIFNQLFDNLANFQCVIYHPPQSIWKGNYAMSLMHELTPHLGGTCPHLEMEPMSLGRGKQRNLHNQ